MSRPSKPKRILITHVYSSDNKGDAALTAVLIRDLRRAFPAAELRVLTLQPSTKHRPPEGAPEQPSFMHYALERYRHPVLKLIYTLYMFAATLLWARCKRSFGRNTYLPKHLQTVADAYVWADLVVPVGGGYLRSRPGLMHRMNVPLLLHPLWFGHVLGKPTVLYSQSVGPFQNRFEGWLVARVLQHMTLILLREDVSVALLQQLGVSHNVLRAIDSGFLLSGRYSEQLRQRFAIPRGKRLLGVTVRAWLPPAQQEAYERAVAHALDTLCAEQNLYVVFVPQVTAAHGDDDRIVSQRVHARMRRGYNASVMEDELDHEQIKGVYEQFDALLGTRFHSVIFSLTATVPVLAIEYEHKTSGIMHDLGLGEWVVKIEDVTAKGLTKQLRRLFARSQSYSAQLTAVVPPYIDRAQEAVRALAAAYARTKS